MDTNVCKYKIYIVCKYTHPHTHTQTQHIQRERAKDRGRATGDGSDPLIDSKTKIIIEALIFVLFVF